jgi:tetratricopeptide (TPR) repeat protein
MSPEAGIRNSSPRRALLLGAVLAAVIAACYARSLGSPLVFDDIGSVTGNPSLRSLGASLTPPQGATVSGRPVVNFTFALNQAAGGGNAALRATNVAILVLSALVLFGLAARLLRDGPAGDPLLLAFAAALVWAVHPLLTESVTYVVQRAESLMGLCCLVSVYAFVRGVDAGGPGGRAWFLVSVVACALGTGTKEAMVSAPVVILLVDRTFFAGSFREALKRRRLVYTGLAATWILLLFLVLSTHGRSGSAGFGTRVSLWDYGLVQLRAVAHYLRLSVWPSPLVFDYGTALAPASPGLIPPALAVAAVVAATAWALLRRPKAGFLGAVFLVLLAPSSSFVPVATEPISEHRMYLPLIPVVFLAALALDRWIGRRASPVLIAVAAALAWATVSRNEVYRSEEGLWRDTVAKVPGNSRAWTHLGNVLVAEPGRAGEATAAFEAAARVDPGAPEPHYNLGNALALAGQRVGAEVEYTEALRLDPQYFEAHCNFGNLLASEGRLPDATVHYREALRLRPGSPEARYNLGNALAAEGKVQEAETELSAAVEADPRHAKAHIGLGRLYAASGRLVQAEAEFRSAVGIQPANPEARCNWGNALGALGRLDEAIVQYRETLRLRPDYALAHFGIAIAILKSNGSVDEAEHHLREVIRLEPENADAREILERINSLRR